LAIHAALLSFFLWGGPDPSFLLAVSFKRLPLGAPVVTARTQSMSSSAKEPVLLLYSVLNPDAAGQDAESHANIIRLIFRSPPQGKTNPFIAGPSTLLQSFLSLLVTPRLPKPF